MKKICSVALAAAILAGSLVMPASATFSDVTDADMALDIAALQSMGVVNGYTDGSFRASNTITRAEFSSMIVKATDNESLISSASGTSPFTDVPTTHWAHDVVNVAYSLGYLNGNGDGTFSPDRTITVGEAVTVVLRILGYTTADIGYNWPTDHVAMAQSLGLLDDINKGAYDTLTRGDMVYLTMAMIQGETSTGSDYIYSICSNTIEDVIILDNDAEDGYGGTGLLWFFANGTDFYYEQETTIPDDFVFNCRGTLLLDKSGTVIGFISNDEKTYTVDIDKVDASGITNANGTTTSISSSAEMIFDDESMIYGSYFYKLENYASAILCYGDDGKVAMILPQNSLIAEGYVVTGYFESALPNTSQPETVTVLGATFDVNDDVAPDFAKFALGEQIHLTLDSDGDVMAVTAYSSSLAETMYGVLNSSTSITLSNGVEIECDDITTSAEVGSLVTVKSLGMNYIGAYSTSGGVNRDFNVSTLTVGTYPLASNVAIYECVDGSVTTKISLDDITTSYIDKSQVDFANVNSAGEIDILLLDDVTGDRYTYGYISISSVEVNGGSFSNYTNKTLSITYSGGSTKATTTGYLSSNNGDLGGIVLDEDGNLAAYTLLTSLGEVSRSAFSDTDSVVVDGVRITIADDVQVYNKDTKSWMTLTLALTYVDTLTCYYDRPVDEGGKVRVIIIDP